MRRFALTVALASIGASLVGCGDVYDEVAPPEKRVVEAQMQPDFVRGGETMKRVDAFIDIEAERTFVTSIDLGPGIDVVRFDTTQPCSEIAPPTFVDARVPVPFQVCLTLSVEETADTGERLAAFELRADNELVISEAPLFVLPAL